MAKLGRGKGISIKKMRLNETRMIGERRGKNVSPVAKRKTEGHLLFLSK